jgi:hypothetical protein
MSNEDRFICVAARDISDTLFKRGDPFPVDQAAKITDLFWTEPGLQIFASGNPRTVENGHIMTLANPSVLVVVFAASLEKWKEEMDAWDDDFRANLAIGIGVTPTEWAVGGEVPGGGWRGTRIEAIIHNNEDVLVYATSPAWNKAGKALKFLLPKYTFRGVHKMPEMSEDAYGRLLKEAVLEDESEEEEEEEFLTCSACEAVLDVVALYCTDCGKPTAMLQNACLGCRSILDEDAKFCGTCGTPREKVNGQAAHAAPATAPEQGDDGSPMLGPQDLLPPAAPEAGEGGSPNNEA